MESQKISNFNDFELDASIMEGIESMGFTTPTPIQELGIPIILRGDDLIGCAQTGTGKTAAFLLPMLQKIISFEGQQKGVSAMIIVPTRELATQIDQQFLGLSYFTNISSIAVYGGGDGMSWDQQKNALEKGADIIIATPGRLIAHLQMGYLNFQNLKFLVLDEADRMLDMGFHADIIQIVKSLPEKRQTLMFSATMPRAIRNMAKELLNHPEQIDLAVSKPPQGVLQAVYKIEDSRKVDLILDLLVGKELNKVLLFSSTKSDVKKLARTLGNKKLSVSAIHSDLTQKEREQALLDFKNENINILVATDIVSRGIDIDNIDLVINYHVPQDAEDYVHRVGRTARAKATGVAITLVNKKEIYRLKKIENLIEQNIFEIQVPKHI